MSNQRWSWLINSALRINRHLFICLRISLDFQWCSPMLTLEYFSIRRYVRSKVESKLCNEVCRRNILSRSRKAAPSSSSSSCPLPPFHVCIVGHTNKAFGKVSVCVCVCLFASCIRSVRGSETLQWLRMAAWRRRMFALYTIFVNEVTAGGRLSGVLLLLMIFVVVNPIMKWQ